MERSVDILAQLLVVVDISAIEAQIQLEELAVAIDVIEDILCRVQHHLADSCLFNADLTGYAHTVFRAVARLLIRPVDFVLVWRLFIRPNETLLAGKDQTTAVGNDSIDTKALWRHRHVDEELTTHGAYEEVT